MNTQVVAVWVCHVWPPGGALAPSQQSGCKGLLPSGRFLHSLHFSAFPYSASPGLGPKHSPICSSGTYSSVIATPSRTYMYPESRIRVSRLLMSPFLNNNSHCGLEPRMSCSHRSALPQNAPFICRARVLGAGVGVPSKTKCCLKITSEESTGRPLVMSSAALCSLFPPLPGARMERFSEPGLLGWWFSSLDYVRNTARNLLYIVSQCSFSHINLSPAKVS